MTTKSLYFEIAGKTKREFPLSFLIPRYNKYTLRLKPLDVDAGGRMVDKGIVNKVVDFLTYCSVRKGTTISVMYSYPKEPEVLEARV